ncbi:hypothetical protein [Microtetraspora niveoalba]|uniref:hypothetical protein n=1 Tax=Microtetraspora niveoalba TaxID=46175 RepID=UPI00083400C5|nr:hypothetical protein [Microtetraspora niveoalba]
MKTLLEVVGWVALVQGVGGTVNTLLGWWRWAHDLLIVHHVGALAGYEVFASITLAVLGLALLGTAGTLKKGRSS